jgi:hypothetical protein
MNIYLICSLSMLLATGIMKGFMITMDVLAPGAADPNRVQTFNSVLLIGLGISLGFFFSFLFSRAGG